MQSITLTIPGNPIAKKRPRFVRRGKFVGTYNCQETEEGRFKWELAARTTDRHIIETPIRLICGFFMPIPASISPKPGDGNNGGVGGYPMPLSLVKASEVKIGDLLESPDQTWRPVVNIERQFGRIYFIMGVVSRSALITDLVAVGREE